jgi:ATP-dependent Clp protease protease subunit
MDTLVAQLLFLDSVNHDPINLYINSQGGEVYSGLELISVMRFIKSPVYTTVLGLAASMGAVIASSGEKGHRTALPYSRFMIHQPSSGIGYSTFKDQAIHLKEMESLKQDLYKILAENSGQSIDQI